MVDALVLGTSDFGRGGSSPFIRTRLCRISSAVEQLVYTEKVGGSIPSSGTIYASVAQLDRALDYESKGYRLESCRGLQN